ncbi:hypothetical protein DFR29_10392 [Tahibacter aquaticus]|uniref:Uncharacterized protein n=1 Tax=Tahibacter aquaticus TaxID=520092 RepID=A0A4R6Z4G9_9GAMM|nr:hypothetical protein [Tahibacter aquaticus]TDR46560.1 hypothetical protein DFR29_10392 [Tahibacter aquaticus]
MKGIAKVFVVALGFALSFAAVAAEKLDPALQATTKEKFDDQAAAIRSQMKAGGRWEFVDAGERDTVEKRLDEITALMASSSEVGELPGGDKAKLLEAQEEVNAILTKKDGRRLICQNVAPTGSNRKQKTCTTFAERERERRESQNYLRNEVRQGGLRTN